MKMVHVHNFSPTKTAQGWPPRNPWQQWLLFSEDPLRCVDSADAGGDWPRCPTSAVAAWPSMPGVTQCHCRPNSWHEKELEKWWEMCKMIKIDQNQVKRSPLWQCWMSKKICQNLKSAPIKGDPTSIPIEILCSRTSLESPAIPAPPSRCPTLVFTAPSRTGSRSPSRRSTERKAPVSMGSPSSVPVPWVSTWCRCLEVIWASSSAIFTTNSWEGPLGEVKFALRPSWFRALPKNFDRFGPVTSRFCKTWAPQPSPRAYPDAEESKVWHRPSDDNIRAWQQPMQVWGNSSMLTPQITAKSQRLWRMFMAAVSAATREDEQAVSTVALGPFNPRE